MHEQEGTFLNMVKNKFDKLECALSSCFSHFYNTSNYSIVWGGKGILEFGEKEVQ